ncbi:uncharacterized protein UHO2_05667 [Ustilago hordei]|uniref:Uncharacterized protein n=1 Tax=Ustilago hordei TaxID=120017 RepID=I2FRH0_USTHO|nr:uncharacterized protein UHO2_05667 [Ustilago hordei]CCF49513.1 uncharacterized protein UHOR_07489 [Ustilago hordei]SYW76950.1 uncharacterized protein UHO2_05667 [Ustilago hordei]
MATSTIILALVSIGSSLLVLIGSTTSTLSKVGKAPRFKLRLLSLDLWQRVQFCICLLDSVLLLAVTPLFGYYFYHHQDGKTVWDVAFSRPASVFATTAVTVVRPVLITALVGCNHLGNANKRCCNLLLPLAAVVVVAAVSTAMAVSCSFHSSVRFSCAPMPRIKIAIATIQALFAILATTLLFATTSLARSKQARMLLQQQQQQHRPFTIASRAPSLSLLIHTQPDPWTRHIHLDLPHHHVHPQRDFAKTDFAPPIHKAAKQGSHDPIDYRPKMVSSLLNQVGTASDRMTDATTTSLGYGSAVASSANPYHVGSTFSLASRDALTGFASSSLDLLESRIAPVPKYQTCTSKPSLQPIDGNPLSSTSSRPPTSAKVQKASRASSRRAQTSTSHLRTQDRQAATGLTASRGLDSRAVMFRLIATVSSLWCPVALLACSLLISDSSVQAHMLLASFCSPAAIILVQELATHLFAIDTTNTKAELQHSGPHRAHRTSNEMDACSQRASVASSAVVVYENHESVRNRRPHLRSYSCPLESERNGYSNPFLDSEAVGKPRDSKQRQSLSSAKSVPYLSQHWTAGRVKGDRVVAPRSSFMRGLNLMMNPRPKLQVLPAHSQASLQKYRDCGDSASAKRASLLPASVTSAIVEGLLDVPRSQELVTTDSERTCITQGLSQDRTYAASPVMPWDPAGEEDESGSARQAQSMDERGQRSTDVILNMDDTPGSPRRVDTYNASVEDSLRSPTKRHALPTRSIGTPEQKAAATTSFSHNDGSQISGSSASRLFSEIMDMVRGNLSGQARMSHQPREILRGNSLKRTPPKGYAEIDGGTTLEQVSIYNSAQGENGTVIIHSGETSCYFETAASQDATFMSRDKSCADATFEENREASRSEIMQHGSGLTRKGSASSTLSFSSISSRIRSIGRSSLAGASGSPSSTPGRIGQQNEVKKMRSRTFASAFGIELGLLNRNGSKSRKDTAGYNVESSPSTSSGTCPSSLMDLSFSPSPASVRQRGSPGEILASDRLERRVRMHRRNQSRADSIMDMLDDEHGDTIEEMLDPAEVDTSQVTEAAEPGACRAGDFVAQLQFAETAQENPGPSGTGFDELREVDLADMTMNDVWERCFPPQGATEDAGMDHLGQGVDGEDTNGQEDNDEMMGLEMTRLARAPLLDTVAEEWEGESDVDGRTDGDDQHLIAGRWNTWEGGDSISGQAACEARGVDVEVEGKASRESLLLEREGKQRQVTELLAEHEAMFPHKTLSEIVEVTEMPTGWRASGYRTSSGASGSKLSRERLSSTADSSAIRLGLPLSMRCQEEASSREDAAQMTDWTCGTATDEAVNAVQDGSRDGDDGEDSGSFRTRQLAFVTPRSRMRCRMAATRKFFQDETPCTSGAARSEATIEPSPRSTSVRLGQLGMNQGIWARSPVKLDLSSMGTDVTRDNSESQMMDRDGSFQIVESSAMDGDDSRSSRLRRSLTLTKAKLGTEPKRVLMRKLVWLDHHDSPKRDQRNRLSSASTLLQRRATSCSPARAAVGLNQASSPVHEKRLPHKPIKKRRKSRIKGVAVMIARHEFTVVDEDDSLIQRFNSGHQQPPTLPACSSSNTVKA